MSRSDQKDVLKTAQQRSEEQYEDSTQAQKTAQDAISKYVADNPYAKGGEFDTDTDNILSNTADVSSGNLRSALQEQAERTGQNMTAANATAAAAEQANTRALASDEASADKERIAAGDARQALPIAADMDLYKTSTGAAQGTLNTQEQAAQTPSWMDNFGNAIAASLGKTLGGGNVSISKQV